MVLDICVASVAFVLTLCLIPIVYLMNALFSQGPIFFSQTRVGINGKRFKIFKFRSMHVRKDGKNIENSVTVIGHLLRRAHIDELPQSINVIRGDMSIVGPRPYMEEECLELSNLEDFDLRHSIKPGITGLAQLIYEHQNTEITASTKLKSDIEYIKTCSLKKDSIIIAKTFIEGLRYRGV